MRILHHEGTWLNYRRPMTNRLVLVVGAVVVGAVVLAACSGSTTAPTTTTTTKPIATTTTTTTTTTPPEATPAASTTTRGAAMQLTSPAFTHEGLIPDRYTCDGADVSPELGIEGVPEGTVSLVLVVDDPDAPGGTWDHWVVFDIPVTASIPEDVGATGTGGLNSWQRTGYGGPCPPSGTHRYFFTVLALDAELDLAEGATKVEVLAAAEGHVLGEAVLMGTYAR